MSGPSERVRSLSADKRELLRQEIERRRAGARPAGIPKRPAGAPPVLSLGQERLWVLDQMYPGLSTYNATLTMRLRGPLRADLVRAAVDVVVARHEALRTVISRGLDGRPVARLLPPDCGCRWEHTAREQTPGSADRIEDLVGHLHTLAAIPFDLAEDVMMRAYLFEVADDDAVLMFVTNHIASDGWSRDVLFTELTEAYNAALAGRPAELPDLPIQYGDYAAWQRSLVDSDHFDRTLDFWRGEVAGADLVLDVPTDRPRTEASRFTGSRIPFADDGLGEDVRRLGRSAAATAFMTYLAITATMCHALTGQSEFLLGSPSANRERPETARLIGFFVDTIVLRVRLDGDPTFLDVLHRSREAVLRSLGNPVPFDRLVETVRPKRLPGRNPLFQVNYRLQGEAPPLPQFAGVSGSRLFVDVGASRFDLAVGFVDAPGPLRGYLEYNSELTDACTVQAWADALLTLIGAATREPGRSLAGLTADMRADIEDRLARLRPPAPASRASRPITRRPRS